MTDDQGWGQTSYYNHPVLETPHIDAMASNGVRFDRFYAVFLPLFVHQQGQVF